MDKYAYEELEAYTNKVMTFLKVTYSKLEKLIQTKSKKGNFVPQNNLCILKLYSSQIIIKCKNKKKF